MIDLLRNVAEAHHAVATLGCRIVFGARHLDLRHVNEKARVYAVAAGLDALAAEHAAVRPVAGSFVALTVTQNVENSGDDADPLAACFGFEASGAGDRARFNALAATGAGIDHFVDTGLQYGLESFGHTYNVAPNRARLKGICSRGRTGCFHARPSAGHVFEK